MLSAGLIVGAVIQVRASDGAGRPHPQASDTPRTTESTTQVESRDQQYARLAKLARRDPGASHALGPADAPVVMIEYADFQYPFCRKFAEDTQPQLVKRYVEKGVLRIEWRHFPTFGEESTTAAKAAWAAGQQDRFCELHAALFAHAPGKGNMNSGAFTEDELVDLAEEAGVPGLQQFRRDMNSDAASRAVARDRREGYRIGVTSTPAFLINGRPVLGAQPTSEFASVIERAREAARESPESGKRRGGPGGEQ